MFKVLLTVILTTSFVHAGVHDRIRVTGIVYKKFTPTRVQVKDEHNQVFEIDRSAFPKNFKVESGKIFSFEFNTDQVHYPIKKKRSKYRKVSGKK